MATPPYPLPREIRQSAILVGNGGLGPYGPTAFKVFDTADVEVWSKAAAAKRFTKAAGVTVTKTSGAGYDTVSVMFGASVPNTTSFVIVSRRIHERAIAVLKAGTIDADQLEKELSKQGTILQELKRDIERAWTADYGTAPGVIIPGATDTVPKWDAAGNLTNGGPSVTDIEEAADAVPIVLAARDAALAAVPAEYPANRSQLRDIDNAVRKVAWLKEAGREGFWQLQTGNYAADVAADPGQGLFVAPKDDLTGATKVWARPKQYGIDAAWFGLVGDGSTANGTAFNRAVTAASRYGEELLIRPGRYVLDQNIAPAINGKISVRGAGHAGDRAGGYNGTGIVPTDTRGTVILPASGVTAFDLQTNHAIRLSDMQITYAAGAANTTRAIKVRAGNDRVSPQINGNTQTHIEKVMTTGAYIAVEMDNCLEYRILNNHLLYNVYGALRCDNPDWVSYQIAWVKHNILWGGTGNFVELRAGGELRIHDNKLQGGGAASVGVAFNGFAGPGYANMEPLFLTDNSFEGQNIAVQWNTANDQQASTQIVVSGNQFWMGSEVLRINPGANPGYPWVIGLTWAGNMNVINGGAGVGPMMVVSGLSDGLFGANTFELTSGTGSVFSFGTNNVLSRIKRSGNLYGVGLTHPKPLGGTPAVPASGATRINDSALDIMVHLEGGTVTAVKVDGDTLRTQTPCSVYLPVGRSIELTYTVAPTWAWQVANP